MSDIEEQVVMLTPTEVKARIDAGDAYVVDVREADEFAEARIATAKLVPLSTFDPAEIDPPADKMLILHCRTARRCGLAADQLVASGYTGKIHRMAGGIVEWRELGLPVETGPEN
jgi:rhodanese-related sulfurtransferase